MAKPDFIELESGPRIPILHEDRSSLALDKPAGWLLAPSHWRETRRNLQAALEMEIAGGAFWARSRNLKFLRFVHRLDAETSGILLFAKSRGAIAPLGALFERRDVEKRYLAVVRGKPVHSVWRCLEPIGEIPGEPGRMRVDRKSGRDAETVFRVLAAHADPRGGQLSLLEALPLSGRTHQIRVHLLAAGHPVLGDALYGDAAGTAENSGRARRFPLALRAVGLAYHDPFTQRAVHVTASSTEFLGAFGFAAEAAPAKARRV